MTSEEKRAIKAAVDFLEALGYKSGDIHDDLLATIQSKWEVKSRTVTGLHRRYREFIVVKDGSTSVLSPFRNTQDALKQAEYMNSRKES